MATLRAYIASQSSIADGNTVRDHIQNPATIGGGGLGGGSGVEVIVESMGEPIILSQEDEVTVR